MNKYVFFLLVIFSTLSNANQTAVSDTGDIVILKSDGTWSYQSNENIKEFAEIPLNKKEFNKGKKASFNLKSQVTNSQFSFNPKLWSFEKEIGDSHEYSFTLKGEDLYGMVITEGMELPIETLASAAMINFRSVAPAAKVIHKEYRVVNGNKVLYMETLAPISGVEFVYKGYYFSNESGSTQYLVYTSNGLAGKYKNETSEFLNGFSVQ